MLKAIGTVAALVMTCVMAFAGEAEGQIKKVDREKLTITLADGKTYQLPSELDVAAIKEGMDIVLAYEQIGQVRQITDMELTEQ